MVKRVIRGIADSLPSEWVRQRRHARWIRREAAAIQNLRRTEPPLDVFLDRVMSNAAFRPDQRRPEIMALLRLLQAAPPRRVLEIGGRRGGTLLLFSYVANPTAHLASIDRAYSPIQQSVAERMAGTRQQIACVAADSHAVGALEYVREWLGRDRLDLLFVDGDHSLDGVRADISTFAPLLRPGGILAIHDIVPDAEMRRGERTDGYGGGVPLLWRAMTARALPYEEFVEDPRQDGMGIGVIRWSADWARQTWA